MFSGLFLYDYSSDTAYTYSRLLSDVNGVTVIKEYGYTPNLYDTFVSVITAIVHNENLTLIDSGLSAQELENLHISDEDIIRSKACSQLNLQTVEELITLICKQTTWSLTLFTSGTTGIPKQVSHPLSSLIRAVRSSDKHIKDIWGYAYNPTHIAGLQVFFQALLNANPLINLFEAPRDIVLSLINQYQITHISATPTFFRLLLPLTEQCNSIIKLTSGGEKFDTNLSANLLQAFPNASLRNVYASTEAGTILESRDDVFSIIDEAVCIITMGELYIHKSLLGVSAEATAMTSDWYATGDMVEVIETNPLKFRFVNRKNEMINVGGYKVNPYDVEQAMETHSCVLQAYVYGKPNPVLGSILMADVVSSVSVTERELREYLAPLLQPYKIPRIINFVESIPLTRTGKLKRI